jgi:hypothetical protein
MRVCDDGNNAAAGIFDKDEVVQGAEIKVGNGEEVEGGNSFAMIVQPTFRWPEQQCGCYLEPPSPVQHAEADARRPSP